MSRYNMLANLKRTLALARGAGEDEHEPSGGLQVAILHQNKVMTKDNFPAGAHLEPAALFHTKCQVGDIRVIHPSEFPEGAFQIPENCRWTLLPGRGEHTQDQWCLEYLLEEDSDKSETLSDPEEEGHQHPDTADNCKAKKQSPPGPLAHFQLHQDKARGPGSDDDKRATPLATTAESTVQVTARNAVRGRVFLKAREAPRASMLADLKKILVLAETEGPLQDITLHQDRYGPGNDAQDYQQLHLTAQFQTKHQVGNFRLFLPTESLEGTHFTPQGCQWRMQPGEGEYILGQWCPEFRLEREREREQKSQHA